ncbi:MAG: FCD domain-containing protein, partial [Giesbergeria sp.]
KLNRHNSLLKQGRIDDSLLEHRRLMQALCAHDGQATRQAMQDHFHQGLEAAT